MAQKKKRSFRKEYLNDFKKDSSGKYSYTGAVLEYDTERGSWKKDILIMWICCVIPAALLIAIGCMPRGGLTGNFLIILPYALDLIALFIMVWKLVRLTYAGTSIRSYIHKSVVGYLPGFATAAMITAVFSFAGMIITLILRSFEGSTAAAAIYIAAQVTLACGALLIIRTVRAMPWTEG